MSDMTDAEFLRALAKRKGVGTARLDAIADRLDAMQEPPKTGSIMDALRKAHEAGGHAWDKIKAPEAFIAELRGGAPKWRKEPPDVTGWWTLWRIEGTHSPNHNAPWMTTRWYTTGKQKDECDIGLPIPPEWVIEGDLWRLMSTTREPPS